MVDRRTDRQILIARPRLHSMQRGKNGNNRSFRCLCSSAKRIPSALPDLVVVNDERRHGIVTVKLLAADSIREIELCIQNATKK